MKYLRLLVRMLFLGTVAWAFLGGPFCHHAVEMQGLVWGLVASVLFGRFFCDAVCPLGIMQGFVNWAFHPKSHVRRVCTRLPETVVQRIVRWTVFAACAALVAAGFTGLAALVFPISIFGKAITLWDPGLAVGAFVLVSAAFGRGRFWCNWICPFGTLYALASRVALFRNRVGGTCGHCRACFGARDRRSGVGNRESGDGKGVTRREALKGVAVLAAAEKLTDGGLAPVSLPGVPDRGHDVLPPGAGDRRTFARKCIGCQLCVANCPGSCLVPSTALSTFGQPVMDFRRGHCLAECVKCGEVCPAGALEILQREQRPHVHLGHAVWTKDLCVRTTNGDPCTACVRKCPFGAIHLVEGFPVVDRQACIGCGACEHVCPARPMPAIQVKGFEMQRKAYPMDERVLVAEMKSRIATGASVVVARNGVIVAIEDGRGIGPLLRLLDAQRLRGAIVVDKVIGRAAAAICVVGGAAKVYASLAGKGAAELLKANGVRFEAEKTVDTILNHEQKGCCPMEKAVEGLEDPERMVDAIRKALLRLK